MSYEEVWLKDDFAKLIAGIESVAIEAIHQTTSDIFTTAQATCPVLSGELRDSHEPRYYTAGPYQSQVYAGSDHAFYVHDGTRRMPQRPWLADAAHLHFPAFQDAFKRIESMV